MMRWWNLRRTRRRRKGRKGKGRGRKGGRTRRRRCLGVWRIYIGSRIGTEGGIRRRRSSRTGAAAVAQGVRKGCVSTAQQQQQQQQQQQRLSHLSIPSLRFILGVPGQEWG